MKLARSPSSPVRCVERPIAACEIDGAYYDTPCSMAIESLPAHNLSIAPRQDLVGERATGMMVAQKVANWMRRWGFEMDPDSYSAGTA